MNRDLLLNPLKLEVGESYINRMGTVHTIHYIDNSDTNFYRAGLTRGWYQGGFNEFDKTPSPYDLVEVYTINNHVKFREVSIQGIKGLEAVYRFDETDDTLLPNTIQNNNRYFRGFKNSEKLDFIIPILEDLRADEAEEVFDCILDKLNSIGFKFRLSDFTAKMTMSDDEYNKFLNSSDEITRFL